METKKEERQVVRNNSGVDRHCLSAGKEVSGMRGKCHMVTSVFALQQAIIP